MWPYDRTRATAKHGLRIGYGYALLLSRCTTVRASGLVDVGAAALRAHQWEPAGVLGGAHCGRAVVLVAGDVELSELRASVGRVPAIHADGVKGLSDQGLGFGDVRVCLRTNGRTVAALWGAAGNAGLRVFPLCRAWDARDAWCRVQEVPYRGPAEGLV